MRPLWRIKNTITATRSIADKVQISFYIKVSFEWTKTSFLTLIIIEIFKRVVIMYISSRPRFQSSVHVYKKSFGRAQKTVKLFYLVARSFIAHRQNKTITLKDLKERKLIDIRNEKRGYYYRCAHTTKHMKKRKKIIFF